MVDLWRGRVYVQINSTLATNQAPIVFAKPYLDGWQYQVELARSIERPKLVSGLVQVLLLEIANRTAGLRSAEIPLWLSEGLAQALIHESVVDLVVPHPERNVNLVSLSWQARQAVRRDPLREARERLQTHAALSFTKLGIGLPNSAPDETWKTFQASAQLFLRELVRLPGGRSRLVQMLYELPHYLNWQTAFLDAFRGQFPRLLDAEKWWAVTLTHFTGQDPTQAWAMPVALQKLDEALHPPVLVSSNRKDMPQRMRMSVQRIINDLHKQGLVAFETNPHHRRAQLVVATDRGKQAFDTVMRLQAPWINALADGLSSKDLQIVHRVLVALREKLESNGREDQD